MKEPEVPPDPGELLLQAPIGILVVSLAGPPDQARVAFANPAAAQLAGATPEQLIGQPLSALIVHDWSALFERMVSEPDSRARLPHLEGELVGLDGSRHAVSFLWTPFQSGEPGPSGSVVLALIDESHHRRVAEQLRHQALHDPLTGLANRILVVEHVEQALRDGRGRAGSLALAYVDVDDLKSVNESMGHAAGDELLIVVARRLARALRPTDIAGRLGGDEFVVIFPGVADEREIRHLGDRILSSVAGPVLLGRRTHPLSISVGVATASHEPVAPVTVMNRADEALRRAKRQGKNQVAYFDHALDAEIREEHVLDAELRRAIALDELRLAFQPIVRMHDGHVEGMEALVRWQHPNRGLLSPVAFLPTAEELGAVIPLGRWVIDAACHELRRLFDARPDLVLSINVSAAQLGRAELVPAVQRALDRNGLPHHVLRVEVTETAMTDSPASLRELWELDRLGVRVGIDDFGTGYGSLTYLQSLPARFLKIDRSFIADILHNGSHLAIVRAVIDLARNLGISVVAEGVETSEQAALLRDLGCPSGQGYLYSRPVTAARLDDYLATTA